MTGLKDRQRLALYVALGLSAGSGLTLDASTAYANDIVLDTDQNGTYDAHAAAGDNVIVRSNAGTTPTITDGDIVGSSAADANGITVTVDSVKAESAGYGRVYAARSTGDISNNHIVYNNNPNSVVNELLAAASATAAADSAEKVHDNDVQVNGGTVHYNVTGGMGTASSKVYNNKVSVTGGTIAEQVNGGAGGDNATVTGNEVTISGGNLTTVNGGIGKNGSTVNDNTVTVTGGIFGAGSRIVGGETGTTSTKSNANKIILGSEEGVYTAQLDHTEIWGSRYDTAGVIAGSNVDERIKENTLTVNAQNVAVDKVRNFEKYKFNLNKGVDENATMLTVADTDGFGTGANVAWSNIEFSAKNWTDVKNGDGSHTHYGKSGVQTLIQTSDTNQHLVIHNETASPLTRTGVSGDFEYKLATDNAAAVATAGGSVSVAKVTATVNRIQNANAVYDATGRRPADTDNAVRGGYSEYGHDVTKNTLKVTNIPTGGLDAAYGGEVAGLAGEVFGNNLLVTGTNDHASSSVTQTLTNAYGGAITNVDNAGVVGGPGEDDGNAVTVSGGQVTNVYGGYTVGAGNVQGNAVYVAGGTVTDAYGGASSGNGTVTGNVVALTGGTTGNAYGSYASGGAVRQ